MANNLRQDTPAEANANAAGDVADKAAARTVESVSGPEVTLDQVAGAGTTESVGGPGVTLHQVAGTGAVLSEAVPETPTPTQEPSSESSTASHDEIQAAIGHVFAPPMEVGDVHLEDLDLPLPTEETSYDTMSSWGLYLTLTHPPVPPVTYRIQLNTTLGQAQSDMKLIVTNEIAKASAQGAVEALTLGIDVRSINIEGETGTTLSYEILQGSFVEGEGFVSAMEREGRVIDGESYTRAMFEKAARDTSSAGRMQNACQETDMQSSPPSQSASHSQSESQPESHSDLPSLSPRANRIESHYKTLAQQTPTPVALYSPIKKRTYPADEPTQSAYKKPRLAAPARSPSPSPIAQDTAETELEIFCRCRQPDDGTDMLGCDGNACRNNGWVHMECFPEIEAAPVADGGESKWFCPDCEPEAFEVKKKKMEKNVEKKSEGKGVAVVKKKDAAGKKKF